MEAYQLKRQQERRLEIYQLYLAAIYDNVDNQGELKAKGPAINYREKLWLCLPLLEYNEKTVREANNILEEIEFQPCHFSPMTALQILLKYRSKLSELSIKRLEQYIKGSLSAKADPRIHFTMYNDNFASMAIFILLAAGELFNDQQAFQAGRGKLEGLKSVLQRNGVIMEYGSPTYTPIDLLPLAEVVNYIEDPEVKKLAYQCEERMWAEIASHYHPESAHLAGPYSRAYHADAVGHPHLISGLLYHVFGKEVFVNPVDDLFPPAEKQVIHTGLEILMWPNIAWLASVDYHCPDYLAQLLLNKDYPFNVIVKTEGLPSLIEGYSIDPETGEKSYKDNLIEFRGYNGPNTTYMTADYALGTAYSQFHDGGLSESFYLTYRKKQPACSLQDTGVVLSKYIINDRRPEEENFYNVYCTHDIHGFRDEGRKYGIQYKDTAMMIYKPKQFERDNIYSMKLSLLLPSHFSTVEEVYIGRKRLTDLTGSSEEIETVYVKDGPVYMAFIPLLLTNHDRKKAIKVERLDNYLLVSFYNYQGKVRSFTVKELLDTGNGFVSCIKSTADFPDISAFMEYVEKSKLSDHLSETERGKTRWINYQRINPGENLELTFAYSPLSEGIIVETINGKPRPAPIFAATGLDTKRLPFLK